MKYFLLINLFLTLIISSLHSNNEKFPNVLFIAVDDLRPDLGGDMVFAPNIKNFKKNAMEFSQAYCNIPVCGASRSSFLTLTVKYLNKFLSIFSFFSSSLIVFGYPLILKCR